MTEKEWVRKQINRELSISLHRRGTKAALISALLLILAAQALTIYFLIR